MSKKSDHDKKLEEEIRKDRKFTLSEAIGREAAGALSGASPVAPAQQVLAGIDHLLEQQLNDSAGSLARTIRAKLEIDLPLLTRHFGKPADALSEFLTRTLESTSLLKALVRDTDARWGREYQERPHFEIDGKPAHPDDPYTRAGVASRLQDLLNGLKETPDKP